MLDSGDVELLTPSQGYFHSRGPIHIEVETTT